MVRALDWRKSWWGIWTALALGWSVGLGCAAAERGPRDRDFALQLAEGEAALAEGAPEDAVTAFAAALAVVPHEERALHGLASALLECGDPEGALGALSELEEFHGGYLRRRAGVERCRALAAATRLRLAAGDTRGALSAARALPAADCSREESARLLAQALLAEGKRERAEHRNDEALALFRAAAEAGFLAPEALAEAARTLLAAGRRDEALELLSKALHDHPGDRVLRDLMVEALVAD